MGQEGRLHGKVSIGIGGHVEADELSEQEKADHPNLNSFEILKFLLQQATYRELQEEIGYQRDFNTFESQITPLSDSLIYYRNHDAVGCVHIALFRVLEIEDDDIKELEHAVITKGQWMTMDQAKQQATNCDIEFEDWTQAFVDFLSNRTL
jgi:predicted NUDIX family phosphoesterase